MKKILALLLCLHTCAFAQTDSVHLRISLLTVGPGHQEIYEPFGHTGVRIIDSISGTDIVYNYGTFNGYEENFELKFMRGKLLYYLSVSSFHGFIDEYIETHRSVQEQLLTINDKEKNEIQSFLQNNLKPENRAYKYDFFFDNCSTRIRDIFPKTFGNRFHFGKVLPDNSKLSFRDIMNQYLYKEHLYRFGINLLLGSPIDKVMSNIDIMFLPDFLRDGIEDATVNGKPIACAPVMLLPGARPPSPGVNQGLIITAILMLLTLAGLTMKKLKWLGTIMTCLILFITGLLGCLMFVMWFGTDHQACHNNWNILWALPTNLLLIFRIKKGNRYCIIAIALLLVSLLFHLLRIQQLPLIELWPLLLSLLFIYGMIYRKSALKS